MSEIVHVRTFLGVLFITSGCQCFISTPSFNFFPFLSHPLPSVYHHPPFISSLLQTSVFPSEYNTQYFFLPFSPSSKSSLTPHSHILHCRFWQCSSQAAPVALRAFCTAQGNPETLCRVLRGESGIPQDKASSLHLLALCFLGPIPTAQFANIEGKAKEMVSCSSAHESNYWLFSTFSLV